MRGGGTAERRGGGEVGEEVEKWRRGEEEKRGKVRRGEEREGERRRERRREK